MILRLDVESVSLNPMNDSRVGLGGWQIKATGHVLLIQALKPKWRASASLMVKFVENARIIEIKLVLNSGDGGTRKRP